jgi:pyruvate,water dikinase
MTSYVRDFTELGKHDTAVVGGKGANLGEMAAAGLPVPPGFVVTADAYLTSMREGRVRDDLNELLTTALARTTAPDELAACADRMRTLVRKAGVTEPVKRAVVEAYHRLGDSVSVAVRSSATSEDTAGASFAGMNSTFTNTTGDDAVVERLLDCWVSLFGARSVAYRAEKGLGEDPAIAVVVQRMVHSDRSGVMFTADPSTGDRDRMVVEAAFGLGEVVVSGAVEPDTYVLSRNGDKASVVDTRIGRKSHKIVRGADGEDEEVGLTPEESLSQVLIAEEVEALGRLGIRVERHYGEPQDI